MHTLIEMCGAASPGDIPPVDLHMHTTWTDGSQSVAEMHAAATALGLKDILFTEHARKSSGDWFANFASEVRDLPSDDCRAAVGVEVKIADYDGSLDICDAVRKECDLVMASVHRFPGEVGINKGGPLPVSPEEAVEIEHRLSCAAIRAGGFQILGHPFGMSIKRFGIQPPDSAIEDVIHLCARHDVAFEINAQYHAGLWRLIAMCRSAGAPFSLGSNAHNVSELGLVGRKLQSEALA